MPIAIIPQIILAGVMAPLRGVGKWLADGLITVRWAERALEALLPDETLLLLRLDQTAFGRQVAMLAILWRQGFTKGNE